MGRVNLPYEEVSSLWLEVSKQDAVGRGPEVRPKTHHIRSRKAQSRGHPSAILLACVSELAQFQIPIAQPGKGRCGVNLAQGSGSGVAYMLSALYLPVRMTVQSSPEWLLHPEAGRPWPRLPGFL